MGLLPSRSVDELDATAQPLLGCTCRRDMHHDVRDIAGRLRRLALSIPIGAACSLAIALSLPTRRHFGGCFVSEGWLVTGGDPVLVLVGASLIPLAAYTVTASRGIRLPRARLLR
jgi:hypothetical protein